MKSKIFIGIDFGHGETSVSRVPGKNGLVVSQIPLRNSSNFQEKKVFSALCRDDNGQWKFVSSKDDLNKPGVIEGFKRMPDELSGEKREAFKEFAKLVFKRMVENDTELEYDPQTGEANFVICIANPTGWRASKTDGTDVPKEYLHFFQEEVGIKPIKMCINESDAAFYTNYSDYSLSDKVFVIDLGSSTIDFTTYNNSVCISDCCWGYALGAHIVEESLVNYGYKQSVDKDENVQNMQLVTSERQSRNLGKAESALSLAARFEKEAYFTRLKEGPTRYSLEVKVSDLVPKWPHRRQTAFIVDIDSTEVENIIKDYKENLQRALTNAEKRLHDFGITPNKVLLSGGASRMPFVMDMTQNIFPNAKIIRDNNPEWVVSDGAARYAMVHYKALEDRDKLQEDFSNWAKSNLDKKLKSAALLTFYSILKEELSKTLTSEYINKSNGDLHTLYTCAKKVLETVTNSYTYKSKADSKFISEVDSFIKNKLESIILEHYGKEVKISENFIDPKDTFENVRVETTNLHDYIAQIAHAHCDFPWESVGNLDWSKSRSEGIRKALVETLIEVIQQVYEFEHNIDLNEFVDQAVEKIDKILHANGLFEISE